MNKKTKITFFIFLSLFTILIVEGIYLNNTKSMSADSKEKKVQFISMTKLPDLAISTESNAIRHRSLSDIFSIYKDDGSLREYFPSSYAISHSHIGYK